MVDGVSIPLALEDAVPVALSAAGMVVLARGIGHRAGDRLGAVATVAAAAIALGGAAKVTWKLIAAFAGTDVAWLDGLLFPLLATGFAGMASAIHLARSGADRDAPGAVRRVVGSMAGAAALVVALVVVDVELGLRVALVVAVLGSITTSVLLVRVAVGGGDRGAAAMVVMNLLATLGLGRLAAIEDQTLALQWVEQSINTVSQALFLWAAVRLTATGFAWAPGPRPGGAASDRGAGAEDRGVVAGRRENTSESGAAA